MTLVRPWVFSRALRTLRLRLILHGHRHQTGRGDGKNGSVHADHVWGDTIHRGDSVHPRLAAGQRDVHFLGSRHLWLLRLPLGSPGNHVA